MDSFPQKSLTVLEENELLINYLYIVSMMYLFDFQVKVCNRYQF